MALSLDRTDSNDITPDEAGNLLAQIQSPEFRGYDAIKSQLSPEAIKAGKRMVAEHPEQAADPVAFVQFLAKPANLEEAADSDTPQALETIVAAALELRVQDLKVDEKHNSRHFRGILKSFAPSQKKEKVRGPSLSGVLAKSRTFLAKLGWATVGTTAATSAFADTIDHDADSTFADTMSAVDDYNAAHQNAVGTTNEQIAEAVPMNTNAVTLETQSKNIAGLIAQANTQLDKAQSGTYTLLSTAKATGTALSKLMAVMPDGEAKNAVEKVRNIYGDMVASQEKRIEITDEHRAASAAALEAAQAEATALAAKQQTTESAKAPKTEWQRAETDAELREKATTEALPYPTEKNGFRFTQIGNGNYLLSNSSMDVLHVSEQGVAAFISGQPLPADTVFSAEVGSYNHAETVIRGIENIPFSATGGADKIGYSMLGSVASQLISKETDGKLEIPNIFEYIGNALDTSSEEVKPTQVVELLEQVERIDDETVPAEVKEKIQKSIPATWFNAIQNAESTEEKEGIVAMLKAATERDGTAFIIAVHQVQSMETSNDALQTLWNELEIKGPVVTTGVSVAAQRTDAPAQPGHGPAADNAGDEMYANVNVGTTTQTADGATGKAKVGIGAGNTAYNGVDQGYIAGNYAASMQAHPDAPTYWAQVGGVKVEDGGSKTNGSTKETYSGGNYVEVTGGVQKDMTVGDVKLSGHAGGGVGRLDAGDTQKVGAVGMVGVRASLADVLPENPVLEDVELSLSGRVTPVDPNLFSLIKFDFGPVFLSVNPLSPKDAGFGLSLLESGENGGQHFREMNEALRIVTDIQNGTLNVEEGAQTLDDMSRDIRSNKMRKVLYTYSQNPTPEATAALADQLLEATIQALQDTIQLNEGKAVAWQAATAVVPGGNDVVKDRAPEVAKKIAKEGKTITTVETAADTTNPTVDAVANNQAVVGGVNATVNVTQITFDEAMDAATLNAGFILDTTVSGHNIAVTFTNIGGNTYQVQTNTNGFAAGFGDTWQLRSTGTATDTSGNAIGAGNVAGATGAYN